MQYAPTQFHTEAVVGLVRNIPNGHVEHPVSVVDRRQRR